MTHSETPGLSPDSYLPGRATSGRQAQETSRACRPTFSEPARGLDLWDAALVAVMVLSGGHIAAQVIGRLAAWMLAA